MNFVERSSASPLSATKADYSLLARSTVAGGALLAVFGAVPAQAQIYNVNLTTSAANPKIYFSTATGASSFSSFTAATHSLNFTANSDAVISSLSSTAGVAVSGNACGATRYAAGASIDPNSASINPNNNNPIDAAQGWAYPGSGYIGLSYIPTGGTYYYGWASVNLIADDTAKLNSFALQTTPNTAILAGAAPASAAAPEPDAVALLALGASGLAAFRLRRKAQVAADEAANHVG